ncbi:unnamed protein product [Sphagnum troendelagicum]
MAAEVLNLNADKLFKIAKLNLRGRAREWLRRLQPAPANWIELRTVILQKYGNVDDDDIRAKLDAIRQEPRERVQRYFERLDRFFQKGKISDAEQRRRFLARLRPEIKKLCVVRNFADIEELIGATMEVERVLGELGETPFEPLKEEQEEGVTEMTMEHQVANLNNTLINFFKGGVPNSIPPFSFSQSKECQICKGRDHVTTSCPRQIEPRPNAPNVLDEFCGNENVFSYTRIPRRRLPVEIPQAGARPATEAAEDDTIPNREGSIRLKILSHFIKGRVSLTPMETTMMIPSELEQLENLVKVARRKKDAELENIQVRHGPGTDVEVLPLTMVNLIQRSDPEDDVCNKGTTMKSVPANLEADDELLSWCAPASSPPMTTQESESEADSNEESDEGSQQGSSVEVEYEFGDTGLEILVSSEGPQ